MTSPRLFRWCAGIATTVGAALWPLVAFADDCSSELDCQQTPTYNSTTTVIGTAIAVSVAVVSILVSSSMSTGAAAPGTVDPDAAAGGGGDGTGGGDGSSDSPTGSATPGEILDGQDALDWMSDHGLITKVPHPDGSVTWQPTSPDFPGDHPEMPGIVWNEGDDGSINNPVIFVTPDTPPPVPVPTPVPPTPTGYPGSSRV